MVLSLMVAFFAVVFGVLFKLLMPRILQTLAERTELIEGGPEPKRIVILEFADAAAVKRWYNSPEYQTILPDRLNNSRSRAFIVDGL